jgi:hypothetical protein
MSSQLLSAGARLLSAGGLLLAPADSYPGYANPGETVPPGFAGPVANFTQTCEFISEGLNPTPGDWTRANTSDTPSGKLIYNLNVGAMLVTSGYAGGHLRCYAPGGAGAAFLQLVVTRVATGEVIYDQPGNQDTGAAGNALPLLHEVKLPIYGHYLLEFTSTGPVNFDRIEWSNT